jgi:hypothetical protein
MEPVTRSDIVLKRKDVKVKLKLLRGARKLADFYSRSCNGVKALGRKALVPVKETIDRIVLLDIAAG